MDMNLILLRNEQFFYYELFFSLKPEDIQTPAEILPQNLPPNQWPSNQTCSSLQPPPGPRRRGCPPATSTFLAATGHQHRTALLLWSDPNLRLPWASVIIIRRHIWLQLLLTTTIQEWIKIWRQDWEELN